MRRQVEPIHRVIHERAVRLDATEADRLCLEVAVLLEPATKAVAAIALPQNTVGWFEESLEDVAVLVERELGYAWRYRRAVPVRRIRVSLDDDTPHGSDANRLRHKDEHVDEADFCGAIRPWEFCQPVIPGYLRTQAVHTFLMQGDAGNLPHEPSAIDK